MARYLLVSLFAIGLFLSAASAYLRSFNEARPDDRRQGEIKTKIGEYVSLRPIGSFPIRLILALKKWPNSQSCFESETSDVLRWSEFGSTIDLEVCLSRALYGKPNSEYADILFHKNGFSPLRSVYKSQITGNVRSNYSCIRNNICGEWSSDQGFLFLKPYSVSVSVTTSSGSLKDVSVMEIIE